jgi:tripartite-type tricarboxylate transporter receptor subunit TctC
LNEVLRRLHALFAGLALVLLPGALPAADYPTRPIRFVVGVAPGGPTDIFARLVGQRLTEKWGQPVVIDNRPGAGQTIGADIVARAVADGHTLLMGTQTFAVNPSIFKKLPYDSLRDFAPVTLVVRQPLAMFVPPSLPARNLREFIDYARGNPGKLNFGSSGPSSSLRFAGELTNSLAGLKLVHVPYKGTAPALTALASSQVHVVFSGLPAAHPFYSSGRIRALAVAAERRLEAMPDLPTTAEAGLPGLTAESWFGVLAPGRTPKEVIAKLAGEIAVFIRSPEIRKRIVNDGAEAIGNTPAEFAALIQAEMAKWAKVVRENDIRIE